MILELAKHRQRGARLVVTGCMAERYREELGVALPEVDLVAGFGQTSSIRRGPDPSPCALGASLPMRPPSPNVVRSPVAAPARRPRPVGVREGGRGV